MRRRVIVLGIVCLCVGAVALAQAFHLGLLDDIFPPRGSSTPTRAALAAVDTSPALGKSPSPAASGSATSEQSSSEHPQGADGAGNSSAGGNSASSEGEPKLDLAEISTSGSTSVFAGRAAPGASVTVFENGVAVATATANANGDWSLATDHKFAGPDPKFTLRSGAFKIPPEAQDGDARVASNSSSSAAPAGQAAASRASPAAPSPSGELLRNFESKVASAREEVAAEAQAHITVPAAPAVAPPATPPVESKPATAVSVVSPASDAVRDSKQGQPAHEQSVEDQPASIPVPLTFVFDEATLTPEGVKTARLLLEYLRLKKFTAVTLSGHADERGTAEYNMDLSRKRLDTVSAFLRGGGYQGKLDLVPKGASEPFQGIDRSKYSLDDLMQLDRRVELRNAM